MIILVFLRPVLDPSGFTVNRRAQKIFVNRPSYIINPADKNALEAALQMAGEADTVIAVALGEAQAEDILRQARALGAHRALWVNDDRLKQADAAVVTTVCQRVVEQLGEVDLALLGGEVVDADFAQIGPRLAQALAWPMILDAHLVEAGDGVVRAIAPRGAAFHSAEADLPAVITIARDSNKPRYARGLDVVKAYRAEDAVEVWSAADLGLSEADLGPVTERRGESFPSERELGKRLEGSADETASQLAEVIRKS